MAYLRGKTYVDGDLTIEGALQVKRLTSVDGGSFPYLENGSESSNPAHLVQFTSTDGGLTFTPYSVEDNGTKLSLEKTLFVFTLRDGKSSTTSSPVLSVKYVSNGSGGTTGSMYVGSKDSPAASDAKITADNIHVWDYGLKLISDSTTGDYWVFDV